MNMAFKSRRFRLLFVISTAFTLSACVRFDLDRSLSEASKASAEFTQGELVLQRTDRQKEVANARAEELLAQALDQSAAIELALVNSPALQELLANHWASSSSVALSGSIPNPVFGFARLTSDTELEIERLLSIGLLDLIRFPMLRERAIRGIEMNQLQLTSSITDLVTQIRNAWVSAVVAQQQASYAEQVFSSAEASAELAIQMQAIGNFNSINRARQQAFYADAATGLAASQHNALATREELVRLLGLNRTQARALKLPDRLPDLPDEPIPASTISNLASETRLDVAMASAELEAATRQQGIELVSSVTDIELAGIRDTVWDDGDRETITGYELEVELPFFKNFNEVKNRLNAKSLAASNALEQVVRSASSHLRESYSAYRTNYDIARHYQDEIVPLQQLVSEENVLNYNGMIIGVFELLADSRRQIQTVQASIDALGQFWMADASLRSSMTGQPASMQVAMSSPGGGDEEAGH